MTRGHLSPIIVSMSSTHGRRFGLDYYRTPPEAITVVVPWLMALVAENPHATARQLSWLDAGCGTGAIMEVLHDFGMAVTGLEKSVARCIQVPAHLAVRCADFMRLVEIDAGNTIDNPPYNIAADWIRHCAALLPLGTLHGHLLRLSFAGSSTSRWDLLEPGRSALRFVGPLRDRPSFCTSVTCKACEGVWHYPATNEIKDCPHPPTGVCELDGAVPKAKTKYTASRTDSASYAWYVWQNGYTGPAEFVPLGD